MYRSHTCGELRIQHVNQPVTLAGWVHRIRNLGGMTFLDLRDRYGITQLFADENKNPQLSDLIRKLGREYVGSRPKELLLSGVIKILIF